MEDQCCFIVKHTFLELSGSNSAARRRSWSDSDLVEMSSEADATDSLAVKEKFCEVDSEASTDAETWPDSCSSDERASEFEAPQVPMMQPISVPTQCMVAGPGNMVYMVQMAPNGVSLLCPVQPMQQPAVTLEQQAANLDAYASQLAVEARRAKVAARKSSAGSWSEMSTTRKASVGSQSEAGISFPNDRDEVENDDRTTLMFRNLPNNYTRAGLLDMLDAEGFNRHYSFVYLPTDFKNFAGFGYAFVNFATHEAAVRAKRHFQGYCNWSVPSQKVCEVVWSGPVQGLSAHTERYRNSPVMHDSVPDEYKPVVFVNGQRVPFPPPTKKIRPPRVRHGIAVESQVC